MTYDEAIEWLLSFNDFERSGRFQDRPDVAPMLSLLERLGNPHLGRTTVHIAGSKGKGSVAAMVESILRAAAFRTGLYTSPHLHSYRERIQIDGEAIAEAEFAGLVDECLRPAVDAERERLGNRNFVTFDLLTALSFLSFRAHGVEAQIVEVGLGGRVDSTNVFKHAEVAAITPISLEHTAILGDTIEQIAREKAAIIHSGRTAVVAGPQGSSAAEVIADQAREVGAEITWMAAAYTFGKTNNMLSWKRLRHDILGQEFEITRWPRPKGQRPLEVRVSLLGEHQLANAATAVGCIDALGRKLNVDFEDWMIAQGLSKVRWPGRVEVLHEHPLIICDGAHNRDSARRLAETLVEYFACDRALFVIGCGSDKDIDGLAEELSRLAARVIAVRANHPRAMDPQRIAEAFGRRNVDAEIVENVPDGVERALAATSDGALTLICVAGSLFVAAEARAHVLGVRT